MIFCACGCGQQRNEFDAQGKSRHFIQGHTGHRFKKGDTSISGENNPRWKGDSVGKHALHVWIRKLKPMTELCESCKKVPPFDLANITGKYKRDLSNWKYLCRRCHVLRDGIRSRMTIDMSSFVCVLCGSNSTYILKSGRPFWYRLNGKPLCSRCARHKRYIELGK